MMKTLGFLIEERQLLRRIVLTASLIGSFVVVFKVIEFAFKQPMSMELAAVIGAILLPVQITFKGIFDIYNEGRGNNVQNYPPVYRSRYDRGGSIQDVYPDSRGPIHPYRDGDGRV